MMQDYLTAWMNWYYGDGEYPTQMEENMSHDELMEAIKKKNQIKAIVGRSEN
jgi:hypothetical protein